jgi:hypothetical protein
MVLGRMASAIAVKIRGKDSRYFTPSMDMGAYVIVINAEKVGDVSRYVKLPRWQFGTLFQAGKIETFWMLIRSFPLTPAWVPKLSSLVQKRWGRMSFCFLLQMSSTAGLIAGISSVQFDISFMFTKISLYAIAPAFNTP